MTGAGAYFTSDILSESIAVGFQMLGATVAEADEAK